MPRDARQRSRCRRRLRLRLRFAPAEGGEAAPAAAEGEAAPSGKRATIKSAYHRFAAERSSSLDIEGFEGKKMDKIRAEWKDPPNDTIAARKRELEAEVEAEKKARPPPEKKSKRQKKGAAAAHRRQPPSPRRRQRWRGCRSRTWTTTEKLDVRERSGRVLNKLKLQ